MSRSRIASLTSFASDKTGIENDDYIDPSSDNAKRPRTLVFSTVYFNLPVKSGWLEKKSPKIFIGWQWRYFELKDKKLYYFKNTVGRKPKGIINFDLVNIEIVDVKNSKEFMLVPHGCKRKFRIRAETVATKENWLNAISEHLMMSDGKSRKISRIVTTKEWWRIDRISELQFLHSADTGDILLFRSQDASSKLQRALTFSKYDHVAMIIRYATGELALLESTSLDGVAIVRWQDFIDYRWHLLYQMIVYRHLETERNEEMVQKLEDFICRVKGMQYLLNPFGIIKQRDPTGPSQGYFCSQLVASAYKEIGVLHSSVVSVSVLPGHFSYENDLQMIDRSFLGEEQLIDFDLVV
mmetsp:Transcript_12777/g.23788  ORF Transcript_12777/g.23788 Transcript_12777/m.23788 type:complete len:353 (+) Transcript_12777:419-1477(+)|eukprot:CAMPEP_0204914258 /NCGR_PEP_ID=MMETSP1397-20131031/12101_1 /ASSEMBLY_ACC=CAM_ASM_000891 /TAXON_ID=49980 /ORGANISM="Climacostomum Climacostomum virens, Strain Stock W-24" /LENGTH=352 /DNA_ID=CAMNT_0052085729 /DNA_START=360 /DNA_END=1418 /DNA_ORIENTATION=-